MPRTLHDRFEQEMGSSMLSITIFVQIHRKAGLAFQHPFHQFELPQPILKNLDDKSSLSIESMRDMEPAEIGELVHNNRMGGVVASLLTTSQP
jgi:hypothetical protein